MNKQTQSYFYTDPYCQEIRSKVTAISGHQIELDCTIFYPEGGGQPGDTGTFQTADGHIYRVFDTTATNTTILHHLETNDHELLLNDELLISIDWKRRYRLMRMHTSMHLLCSIIPVPVTGGSVGEEKSRLDFDLGEHSVNKDELTEQLNYLVKAALPISIEHIADQDLDANPELVRTMSVQPPRGAGPIRMIRVDDTDYQPCGGTHVRNTSEIGRLIVSKIENKGKRNRRIHLLLVDQKV